ncbi:hypothetical protein [Deinococcus humi]|uniref:Uncharacterized protein n=1 Tax=Deinococcus humi TaxID=662880 RepID=A0A7W8JUZ6_9DEIO|nr:hypothetical protein [Deinococcus humi]MBB5363725.1 hypothetical protein [Deinococcus humi]GGO29613.1 hypothetical protein GCM10008949_23380 [Deinococcus humi]
MPPLAPEHQHQQLRHPSWPLCFLVSRDGQQIRACERVLPFAGMWNGYNPFLAMQPHDIGTLAELQDIEIVPGDWIWPQDL